MPRGNDLPLSGPRVPVHLCFLHFAVDLSLHHIVIFIHGIRQVFCRDNLLSRFPSSKSGFEKGLQKFRPEKRAQRLTFWARRLPGGVGVFHVKGWWPKSSCSPSEVCLPWVSKGGIWDVPGICQKNNKQ